MTTKDKIKDVLKEQFVGGKKKKARKKVKAKKRSKRKAKKAMSDEDYFEV